MRAIARRHHQAFPHNTYLHLGPRISGYLPRLPRT
jgi:hypothetical protein